MSLVTVQLYAEALCPDCIAYSSTQLAPLMAAIPQLVTLSVFPYGNAEETEQDDGSYTFDCQHGHNECVGNMYEACAIKYNPDDNNSHSIPDWYPFYSCMEASSYNQNRVGPYNTTDAMACADGAGIKWDPIALCAGDNPAVGSPTDGNPLMHSVALATPQHTGVPWVVVNGVTLTDEQLDESLIGIVCDAYRGADKNQYCEGKGGIAWGQWGLK